MIRRLAYYYKTGREIITNHIYNDAAQKANIENQKSPKRTDVINFLLKNKVNSNYLEIGVRNPNDNFNKIIAENKFSVDPGIEFQENPVDFQMTSDDFFEQLREGLILNPNFKFDVIFIDGLHTADQVNRDIINSFNYLDENGFVILHDCNPPTEYHAREDYNFRIGPAKNSWNGTTWKAFVKFRNQPDIGACCIDSDWGIGVLSKTKFLIKASEVDNPFYEYNIFSNYRKESLNLVSFEDFKEMLNKG